MFGKCSKVTTDLADYGYIVSKVMDGQKIPRSSRTHEWVNNDANIRVIAVEDFVALANNSGLLKKTRLVNIGLGHTVNSILILINSDSYHHPIACPARMQRGRNTFTKL